MTMLEGYPPAPVLWTTGFLDTVCIPLQCTNWRSLFPNLSENWQTKLPHLNDSFPPTLSYREATTTHSWASVYRYAFETSSTDLGVLTTPTALVTLLLLVLALRMVKATVMPFFRAWGTRVAQRTHGGAWVQVNQARIDKFAEYVFRLCYHSVITVYGLRYLNPSYLEYGDGTRQLFEGYPYHEITPIITWYYLLQAAYNLDAFVSLVELSFTISFKSVLPRIQWSKTIRGDFKEMMIHHVITNLLVIGSSHFRLTRVGSIIFLLHDISDVPVDLSKLANFVKWKWTTLTCFLTMVVCWLVTRLYLLPWVVYRSVLTQSHYVLGGLPPLIYIHYRYFFYTLIGMLILLHAAWFLMFLQIFATFLRKSECHDLSEHKQGEDQGAVKAKSEDEKKED